MKSTWHGTVKPLLGLLHQLRGNYRLPSREANVASGTTLKYGSAAFTLTAPALRVDADETAMTLAASC